jgi:hypothetical protein
MGCRSGLLVLSTSLATGKGWGGLVGACTLLGPEGPDASAPFGGGCGRDLWAPFRMPWVCVGGTARTLRTTQWTRASSMHILSGCVS